MLDTPTFCTASCIYNQMLSCVKCFAAGVDHFNHAASMNQFLKGLFPAMEKPFTELRIALRVPLSSGFFFFFFALFYSSQASEGGKKKKKQEREKGAR